MPMITEPGQYEVTVVALELGKSPNTGTPYIGLKFETAEGQHAYRNLYVSKGAMPYTIETLNTVFDCANKFDPLDHLTRCVVGKKCSITIEQETNDDGKTRLVVRWINALRKVVPLEDPSSLLKQMTAAAGGTPSAFSSSPATAPAASRPAPAADDENLPF